MAAKISIHAWHAAGGWYWDTRSADPRGSTPEPRGPWPSMAEAESDAMTTCSPVPIVLFHGMPDDYPTGWAPPVKLAGKCYTFTRDRETIIVEAASKAQAILNAAAYFNIRADYWAPATEPDTFVFAPPARRKPRSDIGAKHVMTNLRKRGKARK